MDEQEKGIPNQEQKLPADDPSFYTKASDEIPAYSPENEMKVQKEIEDLKRKVSRFFSVYDVRVGLDALAFYLRVNEDMLEENFENLRNLLKPNYIPMLSYEGGEHILFVMKKPRTKYRGTRVNLVLLILTMITTTLSGSLLYLLTTMLPFLYEKPFLRALATAT